MSQSPHQLTLENEGLCGDRNLTEIIKLTLEHWTVHESNMIGIFIKKSEQKRVQEDVRRG